MIAPQQSPVLGDPADHGLEYDDVSFETAHGATLRGSMIHGRADKVILQVHLGVQSSRSGYTREGRRGPVELCKEDIPFRRHVKWLNEQRYSVPAYDTRNHGDRTSGPLAWTSWGHPETPDVIAAVEFLEAHPTYGFADIDILGTCMGFRPRRRTRSVPTVGSPAATTASRPWRSSPRCPRTWSPGGGFVGSSSGG